MTEGPGLRLKLALIADLGMAAAAGAVWLAAHQPPNRPTEPGPILTLIVGASLIGCGIESWRARPENRLGPIMVLTGFAWFASELSEVSAPWLYTFGSAIQYVWAIGLVYLLLSFPSGRLHGRIDRWLMGSTTLLLALQLLAMFYGNRTGLRCPACPQNLLDVFQNNRAAAALLGLERLLGGIVISTTVGVLIVRWTRASRAHRREVAPVLIAGCITLAALVWTITFDLLGDPLSSLPANVWYYCTATVPVAVLFVFMRRQLARGMVAGLVVELDSPGASSQLRHALARALGDPSLQLAYWFPSDRSYVDGDGTPVRLPDGEDGRRATFVEREGQPVAVLIHDPVLEHNAELVASVCAAASLALENERLQAELRARLVDLQASRARLVEATDAERRRIERDLHDGTQQRLVSIAMTLSLIETRLEWPDTSGARPLVRESREALSVALQELRELTHGINPPLLSERGLAAALDELCRRAALPTQLHCSLQRRLPDQVESAAYFVASEALANAAKHSHGSEVRVVAGDDGGVLIVEVGDDGIGGAGGGSGAGGERTSGGTGLRGLTDRVEALGGRLTISSPPGRGTLLRAEIPCA